MTIRERDRQPCAAMPAIPRHDRHPPTSQRMPRVGDFHFCWKPVGVVLQCVTDFKQVLGWTAPKIRDPAAADRWTWLIIAACAQLRLARALAADLRLPWERPAPRHDVGKTTKRELTLKAKRERAG